MWRLVIVNNQSPPRILCHLEILYPIISRIKIREFSVYYVWPSSEGYFLASLLILFVEITYFFIEI